MGRDGVGRVFQVRDHLQKGMEQEERPQEQTAVTRDTQSD